jgi:hypothetical protein
MCIHRLAIFCCDIEHRESTDLDHSITHESCVQPEGRTRSPGVQVEFKYVKRALFCPECEQQLWKSLRNLQFLQLTGGLGSSLDQERWQRGEEEQQKAELEAEFEIEAAEEKKK